MSVETVAELKCLSISICKSPCPDTPASQDDRTIV